jgi:DNA-binding transcriptional LysR family regulator
MVMVGAKHPLAKQKSVKLADIAEQPFIFPKTGFTRQTLDKLFRPFSSQMRVRMELPSVGMIKSFVVAGLGLSIISASFARDEVKSGEAKLLNIEDCDPMWRELGLIYRLDRTLPRAATAFIQLIRERAVLNKADAQAG